MIQTTTALRKIASLKKPIKVVQGGQGASKTFSIVTLLINHASSKQDREIIILSAELTKMRLTVIKDFVNIMKSFGIYEESRFVAGTLYRFRNGSFIKFIGLDKSDVGKGLRSDIAYFNEVNKIDVETYRQVASRADKVYADFNPDSEFFIHTDVVPRDDCDFLKLTFQDNEALSQRERDEILLYKKLGYNDHGEIINKYWANKWRVYGLGEIGSIDGVVFERWDVIEKLPQNARLIYYGVDFGFTTSKLACVAVYKLDGSFIFDEVVYKNNLTNVEAVPFIKNYGYKGELLYCDYAEPKSIQELNNNGLNAVKCESKNDIHKFAIQKLNEQPFLVTKRSENLINELRYYVYDEKTGKPKKSDKDHLMDALTYAVGSGDKYTGTYAVG